MKHRIAVIPGDGIGKEVLPEGMRVLEAAGRRFGVDFVWTQFDWSCESYTRTGRMMPEDGLAQLRPFDAIYLGAVGFPGVPDQVSLWGLLIPIRRALVPPCPEPPRVPSVRDPAPGAAPARGALAARRAGPVRHRHDDRAREQRGRGLGDRRRPAP